MAGRKEFKTDVELDDLRSEEFDMVEVPLVAQTETSPDIEDDYDDADVELIKHKKKKQYKKLIAQTKAKVTQRNEPQFLNLKLFWKSNEEFEYKAEKEKENDKTSLSVEKDNKATPAQDLNEPWVQVSTTKGTPGEQNVKPISCLRAKFNSAKPALIIVSSAVAPMAFVMNSFVAFFPKELTLSTLTWEKFTALDWTQQATACTSALSSEVSNFLMNLENIPKAFESVSLLGANFSDKFIRNSGIVVLSTGAAIAAGAIGASSFIWAGPITAGFFAGANGFLYWATRFYGLVNLSKRYDKYQNQGAYEALLDRLANDPETLKFLLTHSHPSIKKHRKTFERFIEKEKAGNKPDNIDVYDLLAALVQIQRENFTFMGDLKKKPKSEKTFETLGWIVAVLGAISVVPTFAQKFLDGTEKLTGEIPNQFLRTTIGLIFGSATPFMYLNGISQLGDTLSDCQKARKDPNTKAWRKKLWPLIFFMNGLAAASGYNLTRDVIKNSAYIFKDITPQDSWGDLVNRWMAWAAVACVNGKFVASKWLPKPPHVIKRSLGSTRRLHTAPSNANVRIANTQFGEPKTDSATILGYFVQDARARLQANPLSKDSLAELKRLEAPTPNGQIEANAPLNSPLSETKSDTPTPKDFKRVSFLFEPASPTSPLESPKLDPEQAGLSIGPQSEIELPLIPKRF